MINGQPIQFNPSRDYQDTLRKAMLATQWITERALNGVAATTTTAWSSNRRQEINLKRLCIVTALQTAHEVYGIQRAAIQQQSDALDALRNDLMGAMVGLRDFLSAIRDMPMEDGTRAVVIEQLAGVTAAIEDSERAAAEGGRGGPAV